MVIIKETKELIEVKRKLAQKMNNYNSYNKNYSKHEYEMDLAEFNKIDKEIYDIVKTKLNNKSEEIKKMEETKQVTGKYAKNKLKVVNSVYKNLIEEYRQISLRIEQIRKQKLVLREQSKKLHELKNKETLTTKEKQFVDNILVREEIVSDVDVIEEPIEEKDI